MESLNDGDLMIWLDCGFHIKPCEGSTMLNYYSRLLDTDCDIMPFRIKYKENSWNKRDTIEEVIRRYPENAATKLSNDLFQYCTGTFIIKKTKSTMELVKSWNEISVQNDLHFSNNNKSSKEEDPEFIEHRHDQSIFSLLCKLGTCTPDVNNDNFDDDCMSDQSVLQPRRWRN